MKRIALATVLALATVGSASAMTSFTELPHGVKLEVQRLVPNADLTNLTAAQRAAIEQIFASSENTRSGNDPAGAVKAILNWN